MSVGEHTIDAQHQRLLGQLNALIDAMVHGTVSKEVHTAVGFLEQYIKEHLEYEEEYMTRRGYDGLENHKTQHALFRQKYTDFKTKLESGNVPESTLVDIEGFLGQWWVEHIGHEDHKYFLALGPADE